MDDKTMCLTVKLSSPVPPSPIHSILQGHNGARETQKSLLAGCQGDFSATLSDLNRRFLRNLYTCLEDIKPIDTANEISVAHVNIRSLRHKIDELVISNVVQCSCLAITET